MATCKALYLYIWSEDQRYFLSRQLLFQCTLCQVDQKYYISLEMGIDYIYRCKSPEIWILGDREYEEGQCFSVTPFISHEIWFSTIFSQLSSSTSTKSHHKAVTEIDISKVKKPDLTELLRRYLLLNFLLYPRNWNAYLYSGSVRFYLRNDLEPNTRKELSENMENISNL